MLNVVRQKGMLKGIGLTLVISASFMMPPVALAGSGEITVSAAISLKNALGEIGKLYELKNRDTKVFFNFGASGELGKQIEGGAPVDVFASASQADMDAVERNGLIVPGSRTDFAMNALVLIVPADARVRIRSFKDLKAGSVKKIAAGNPKTVPAGKYAEEALAWYKMLDAVRNRLILTENVRQALGYVCRGEVDAGIVYSTDAMAGGREVRIAARASGASHKPIVYPIAIVKGTGNEAAAKAFISIVTSKEGRKILEKYGFRTGR